MEKTVDQIDLQPLHTFYVAATSRTFTEAAERLFLSQSAISHAMSRLERSMQVKLWERAGVQTRLTDAGKRLLRSCGTIFQELQMCREELQGQDPQDVSGHLRLGATVEFGNGILAAKIAPFLAEYPRLEVSLTFRHDLVTPLLAGNLDLIIDCWAHPREELWRLKLFRERYVLVGSPALVLQAGIRRVKDLVRVPWLSLDASAEWWQRWLVQLPAGEELHPKRMIVVNHLRGMVNLAGSGVGVALVPAYCAAAEIRAGQLQILFPKRQIPEDWFSLYGRYPQRETRKVQAFVKFMRSWKPEEFEAAPIPGIAGRRSRGQKRPRG